jgi:hypothetical protein
VAEIVIQSSHGRNALANVDPSLTRPPARPLAARRPGCSTSHLIKFRYPLALAKRSPHVGIPSFVIPELRQGRATVAIEARLPSGLSLSTSPTIVSLYFERPPFLSDHFCIHEHRLSRHLGKQLARFEKLAHNFAASRLALVTSSPQAEHSRLVHRGTKA